MQFRRFASRQLEAMRVNPIKDRIRELDATIERADDHQGLQPQGQKIKFRFTHDNRPKHSRFDKRAQLTLFQQFHE